MRSVLGGLSLVFFIGCVNDLTVGVDLQIRCTKTADCPDNFTCVVGACKSSLANNPPRLTLGSIARSLDAVAIPVTVSDAEGDAVDVQVALRATPGADFIPLTLPSTSGIAVGVDPVPMELSWPSAATDFAAAGQGPYVGHATLRLTPGDAFGPGAAVESAEFSWGNEPPEILDLALDDATVTRNAVVRFLVRDSANDPVALDGFGVSQSGDFSDATSPELTSGAGGTFPGGAIDELRTTDAGVWHNITWDSTQGASFDASTAAIRLRLRDTFGALSNEATSVPFAVNNAQSPPQLTVQPVGSITGTLTTPVQLAVFIDDADVGDLYTLFMSYSLDYDPLTPAAGTWSPAQTADPIVALSKGGPHPLTWDIGQLDPGSYTGVYLRVQVQDSLIGESELVGPLDLDTRVLAADTSAPNYVSPANGAVFTNQTVLLQWTARLGATSYEVDVSTKGDFSEPVPGSPFTTSATELPLTDTELPLDVSYYWQVRTDVPPRQYSSLGGNPAVFHLLLGTLYVYCPESVGAACSDSGAIGNRSRPYQRLNNAVQRAASLGISDVKVASRGGTAAYEGILFLQNGVNISGGYAPGVDPDPPAFATATPDTEKARVLGASSLPYGTVGMIAEGITQPTVVSGLHVVAPAADTTYGLRAVGCTTDLSFSDVHIEGGMSFNSTGVQLAGSDATFVAAELLGGTGQASIGLTVLNGTLVATNSTISAAGGGLESTAVRCSSGATLQLTNTDLISGAASSSSTALRGDPNAACAITLVGGSLTAANAPDSLGIDASEGSIDLDGVSITAGGATTNNGTGAFLDTVSASIVASSFDGTGSTAGAGLVVAGTGAETLSVDSSLVQAHGLNTNTALAVDASMATITNTTVVAGDGAVLSYGASFGLGTVTVSHSTVTSGIAATSVGVYGLNAELHIDHSRIRSTGGAGASSKAEGVSLKNNAVVALSITDCLIYAGNGTTNIHGLVLDIPGGMTPTLARLIIGTGTAPVENRVLHHAHLAGTSAVAPMDTILFSLQGSGAECARASGVNGSISFGNVVFAGCPNVYGQAGNSFTLCTDGTLNAPPCPNSGAGPGSYVCSPGQCRGPTTAAALFAGSFVASNLATWVYSSTGLADFNGSGGWTAGEPGFNAAQTGAP